MTENEISFQIRSAAFKIHKHLGPGLYESVYETTLIYELRKLGLTVRSQVAVPLIYEGLQFDKTFVMDILVNEKVIVEVKAIESLAKSHLAQLQTYLKLSNNRLGLLINFNDYFLRDKISIIRLVNNLPD